MVPHPTTWQAARERERQDLLVLPTAEGTPTAEAGKTFKTITKTISSNGQIAIPDAGGWKLEISAKVKNDETQNKN